MKKIWYCGKPVRQLDPKIAQKVTLSEASKPQDNNEPTSAIKK